VLMLEGLKYLGTHRLQLFFSIMGNMALGAASETGCGPFKWPLN